jgi:ubiquinone/menaquinone biosynthesis C-methylase UbiE
VEILTRGGVFPNREKLTVVVGGLSGAKSGKEFLKFLKSIRPSSHDSVLFLDMNFDPLYEHISSSSRDSSRAIQANLDSLPFSEATVDLLFLDFTPDFMSNITLKRFFNEARRVLKKEGLILAACDSTSSIIEALSRDWFYKILLGVPHFSKKLKDYFKIAEKEGFTPLLTGSCHDGAAEILVLSPSPYPPFSSGKDLDLDNFSR